jgi:hypothetical protein
LKNQVQIGWSIISQCNKSAISAGKRTLKNAEVHRLMHSFCG